MKHSNSRMRGTDMITFNGNIDANNGVPQVSDDSEIYLTWGRLPATETTLAPAGLHAYKIDLVRGEANHLYQWVYTSSVGTHSVVAHHLVPSNKLVMCIRENFIQNSQQLTVFVDVYEYTGTSYVSRYSRSDGMSTISNRIYSRTIHANADGSRMLWGYPVTTDWGGGTWRCRWNMNVSTRSGNSWATNTWFDLYDVCSFPRDFPTNHGTHINAKFSQDGADVLIVGQVISNGTSRFNGGLRVLRASGSSYSQQQTLTLTGQMYGRIIIHPTDPSRIAVYSEEYPTYSNKYVDLFTRSGTTYTKRTTLTLPADYNARDIDGIKWRPNTTQLIVTRGMGTAQKYTLYETAQNTFVATDIFAEYTPGSYVFNIAWPSSGKFLFAAYNATGLTMNIVGYGNLLKPRYPNNTYLDPKISQEFAWELNSGFTALFGAESSDASQLQWREQDSAATPTLVNVPAGQLSYSFPENTFAAVKNYEWQVRVDLTGSGGYTDWTTWFPFTTADALVLATVVSPKDTYIDTDISNLFTWELMNPQDVPATSVELQYSLSGGAYITFITFNDHVTEAEIPGGMLPSGNLRWRVRAFNQDNLPGPWSEAASLVGRGSPGRPNITSISATHFPTITWAAAEQNGFRIEVRQNGQLIFSSGDQFSTARMYQTPQYLAPGTYEYSLYVLGQYELWSQPARINVTVIQSTALPPVLTENPPSEEGEVSFIVTNLPDRTSEVLLVRDGEVIGRYPYTPGQPLVVTDIEAPESANYQVMAVISANEDYVASNTITTGGNIQGAIIISPLAPGIKLKLQKQPEGQPIFQRVLTPQYTLNQYLGRIFPVAYTGGYQQATYNFSFYDTLREEYLKWFLLTDENIPILYRDCKNNVVYGILSNVSTAVHQNLFTLTFTLTETTRQEA